MQFGLDIPNVHHGLGLEAYGAGEPFNATLAVNPETFRRVSTRAEEVGFQTIWIADHLVFPPISEAEHPLSYQPNIGQGGEVTHGHEAGTAVRADDPIYEALATMAFLGALTTRCRIGVGVLVIPYRNPVIAAKMISTIDVLTAGRVTIGAGVGWLKEAFDAVRAEYDHRGAATDEYIDLMRVLWRDERPEFHGEHYQLAPGLRFLPKPVQTPIPIWIGGVSGPALRRAATRGDGWLAVYQSPEEFAANRRRVVGLLHDNGRTEQGFTFAHRVRYMVSDGDGGDQVCIGSPQRVADGIRAYHDAGVDHLQLAPPPGPTTDALVEQVDRFESQVRPLIEDLWQGI
jgi:probable F420-dependent oxidoreductase